MNQLILPKKVYFKNGSMNVALRELTEVYHRHRALLVSDPNLYHNGTVSQINRQLEKQGIRTAEFFSIDTPPSFAQVRNGLPKLLEFQPDILVGIGGGAAMSAAKALWIAYENPELDIKAAVEHPDRISTGSKAMLVLVATSFGNGAQNSPFAELKDDKETVHILKSFQLLPEISVTDSRFTETLSPQQVKEDGLALLALAIHTFVAPGCNEFTEGLVLETVDAVLKNLKSAESGCPVAREKLHNAAALTGAACGNVLDTLDVSTELWPAGLKTDDPRVTLLAKGLGRASGAKLKAACTALA